MINQHHESGTIKEAIILAGGLGTRLRAAVPDLPKCMAPVAGRPFLFYVINYLRSQGIEKFIFSLGHMHEVIEKYLEEQFPTLNYLNSIESEPLGTGGAILLALESSTEENILITNGDTLFKIDLSSIENLHISKDADATLALKPMSNFDRYGAVELTSEGRIQNFYEKQFRDTGNINGGIYLLRKNRFLDEKWPTKFSFEKEFLESGRFQIFGDVQDEYFIDIGVPGDYSKAQEDLILPAFNLTNIDKSWTIFIDRDGVINNEIKGDYVRNWDQFVFYDGAREAFQTFQQKFGQIIIVSNQRGVGKGLMSEADLANIHVNMQKEIETFGGRIDKIYYCTSTDLFHPDRKPNPGIAFRARREMPGIDLARSIMVGNKPSDMLFGRNAGMFTVFIKSTNPEQPLPHADIDLCFDTLADFAKAL
jgi:D-glycero-alpha-D-manno-heptose 1-phosphate guanylyltransferase